MKRIVEDENATPHLESFLGEKVLLKCVNYFYHGTLIEVNTESVKLKDAYLVFEEGAYTDKKYSDAQKMPSDWHVMKHAIESFGFMKDV